MTTSISKNLINDEFVLNTGDTMTGILTINSTDPLIIFQPVTGGSNIVFRDDTQSGFNRAAINSGASGGLNITLNDAVGVLQTQLTFTTDGNVTVNAITPNDVNHLTRKDYVDDNFVSLAGDTMTGNLTVQKSSATIITESNVTATPARFSAVNSVDNVGLSLKMRSGGTIALERVDGSGVFIQGVFTTGDSDQQVTFNDVPRSDIAPTDVDHLTRKDYVDGGLLTQPSKLNRSSGEADLDTLVTGGIYAVLNSQTNYPISGVGSGVLHVMAESSARITQHCRIINSQRWNNLTYIRSSIDSGATWTTWNNIPSVIAVPATITTSGKLGNLAISSTHLYVCTATDTWRRVALSTW